MIYHTEYSGRLLFKGVSRKGGRGGRWSGVNQE